MIITYYKIRRNWDYGPRGPYTTLNAFGFVNNTCHCADFGFLPQPEWSYEINEPYCRCDTRKKIKYSLLQIFEIFIKLRFKFFKVVIFSIIWTNLLQSVIAKTSSPVHEVKCCKYTTKMK